MVCANIVAESAPVVVNNPAFWTDESRVRAVKVYTSVHVTVPEAAVPIRVVADARVSPPDVVSPPSRDVSVATGASASVLRAMYTRLPAPPAALALAESQFIPAFIILLLLCHW